MTTRQKIAFVVVVICQFLTLGFMIAKQEHLLRTGDVVLLKCEPWDPRSLFSGDYVILNYTISTFSAEEFRKLKRDNEPFEQHDTLYAALEKPETEQFWEVVAISHDRRKLKAQYPQIIRGVLRSRWSYRIQYGVEQYFVPQFEGLRLEREIAQMSVEVALSETGGSAIKRLFIEGKEVKFY